MLTQEDIRRRIENLKIGLTATENRMMVLREELKYKELEHRRFREELIRYEKMLQQ